MPRWRQQHTDATKRRCVQTPDVIADAIRASQYGLVDPRGRIRGGWRECLAVSVARRTALGGVPSVRGDHPLPERGERVYDYAARRFAWAQEVSSAEDGDA